MIDAGVPGSRDDWPDGVLASLEPWEQGDLVRNPPMFYFADPACPVWAGTKLYSDSSQGPEVVMAPDAAQPVLGMVTSQTCDIGEQDSDQPMRPWVQVSPVFEVRDKGWRKKLRQGGGPRYWLLVPDLEGEAAWAVDLRIEWPVEKGWLAAQERIVGFRDELQKRAVGERIAWLRGRPAFSTDFNETVVWPLLGWIRQLDREDAELAAEFDANVVEVAVGVDSLLQPRAATMVLVLRQPLTGPLIERLQDWRDGAVESAHDAGIDLQALDFRLADELTVTDYRRLVRIH